MTSGKADENKAGNDQRRFEGRRLQDAGARRAAQARSRQQVGAGAGRGGPRALSALRSWCVQPAQLSRCYMSEQSEIEKATILYSGHSTDH